MRTTQLTLLLVTLAAPIWAQPQSPEDPQAWPQVGHAEDLRLAPMTDQRVGFTLAEDADGRRVVVAIRAFAESEAPSGYNHGALAVDVNGEIMGPHLGDRPRLLNRPEEIAFGPGGERSTAAWQEGRLGLIESWGSARWTVAWAPSIDAWLASPDYRPVGLDDPAWIIIEITDMVYPASFNYLNVKNESPDAVLRCETVAVHVDPERRGAEADRRRRDAIEATYRRLDEQHFGRSALVREPATGREWAYEMDLIPNNYSAADTMGEIETIEDARRIVAPLADQGYSAIMVSGLHMRYTWVPLWESRILPYMRLICQAAHEAGMKVIDHFDVPIFYSGGYPFLLADNHLGWTQRDIRYGTPTRVYCINNPDFRNHFFTWARRVQREAGIDAYQIDEVSFQTRHHCGCQHCRRLFTEQTGFELPRQPDSPVLNNDADPLWQLWRLWQSISMQQFKRDFLTEIRKENPAAFLSDYTTTYYSASPGGGLWPSVFCSYAIGKEGVSRVPFQNYHYCIADRRLYHGIIDAFDSAPWMLWYPLTGSAGRFCWAMSQACNDAQWHVKKVAGSVDDLISWPHKTRKLDFETFADVAMVFSEKSKSASLWTGHYHGMETLGWGEAMVEANIQYHNIHEIAVTPQLLERYKLVILPRMTLIDEANRRAIEAYVRDGGTLIVTAETGLLDEARRPLEDFLLGEMMNLRLVDFRHAPFEVVKPGCPTVTFDRERMLYKHGARMLEVELVDPARSRVIATFRKAGREYPGIIETTYGSGTVYYVATFFGVSNFEMGLHEGGTDIFRRNPDSAPFMAAWLREILGDAETITAIKIPDKLVYTTWIKRDGSELAIHFLNVAHHRPLGPEEIVKRRQISFPLVDQPITLLLRGMEAADATFYSPDTTDPVPCTVARAGPDARLTIPAGSMKMYGLARVRLNESGGAP
ncbi:MAG: beta-galactosidase trimerization domain-containing protein [Armatimonadota bacterium]|nr:beta-galactosidase trimerization domain-containing protein [Armatimonadota bacterium]